MTESKNGITVGISRGSVLLCVAFRAVHSTPYTMAEVMNIIANIEDILAGMELEGGEVFK
jgi:hypothetical protein